MFTIKKLSITTCILIIIISILFYIYIMSYHHISLQDVDKIFKTMRSNKVSSRCRKYNSSYYQCLPNVLFIGASKCGTTSLVQYLSSVENIKFVNRRIHAIDNHREIHRFDRRTYHMSIKYIELADEWTSSPLLSNNQSLLIHYTPHYLYAPSVPNAVRDFYPHADELKFIIMLRDPIERAWSSYWFSNSHLFNKVDQGSIEEFMILAKTEISNRKKFELCMIHNIQKLLKNNESLLSNNTTNVFLNSDVYDNNVISTKITSLYIKLLMLYRNDDLHSQKLLFTKFWKHCFGNHQFNNKSLGRRHIDKGIYFDQIIRWYHYFKRQQFHYIFLKQFSKQPKLLFHKLLFFLDNNNSTNNDLAHFNYNNNNMKSKKSYYEKIINNTNFTNRRLVRPNSLQTNTVQLSLSKSDFQLLSDFYKPYSKALYELIK